MRNDNSESAHSLSVFQHIYDDWTVQSEKRMNTAKEKLYIMYLIRDVLRHLPGSNFKMGAQVSTLHYQFEYTFKTTAIYGRG